MRDSILILCPCLTCLSGMILRVGSTKLHMDQKWFWLFSCCSCEYDTWVSFLLPLSNLPSIPPLPSREKFVMIRILLSQNVRHIWPLEEQPSSSTRLLHPLRNGLPVPRLVRSRRRYSHNQISPYLVSSRLGFNPALPTRAAVGAWRWRTGWYV